MPPTTIDWAPALRHLRAADARLAPLIDRHGAPTIAPTRDVVHALARSIVSQQLSTAAASTIFARFLAIYSHQKARQKLPAAAALLATDDAALRGAGLSGAKVAAIKDLARHVVDKRIVPAQIVRATDAEVTERLLAVRGIGPWSVDMFLMFALARPDVLPVGDLGIKKGMQRHFRLRKLPDAARMTQLAAPWQPFRSVAAWYMWRILES